eukprot:Clim_evm3s200 gene=Clim_evmTU3s200
MFGTYFFYDLSIGLAISAAAFTAVNLQENGKTTQGDSLLYWKGTDFEDNNGSANAAFGVAITMLVFGILSLAVRLAQFEQFYLEFATLSVFVIFSATNGALLVDGIESTCDSLLLDLCDRELWAYYDDVRVIRMWGYLNLVALAIFVIALIIRGWSFYKQFRLAHKTGRNERVVDQASQHMRTMVKKRMNVRKRVWGSIRNPFVRGSNSPEEFAMQEGDSMHPTSTGSSIYRTEDSVSRGSLDHGKDGAPAIPPKDDAFDRIMGETAENGTVKAKNSPRPSMLSENDEVDLNVSGQNSNQ